MSAGEKVLGAPTERVRTRDETTFIQFYDKQLNKQFYNKQFYNKQRREENAQKRGAKKKTESALSSRWVLNKRARPLAHVIKISIVLYLYATM